MEFFENLLNVNKTKKTNKKEPEKDYLKLLYQIPKKDKGVNMPRFQRVAPDIFQQADLLFMPNDKGYKYALTVIDVGSDMSDAEPLKTKEQDEVLRAFETIYNRGYIKYPKVMQVDAGREFGAKVHNFFTSKKIGFRVAEVGRHRQQAKVERLNQTLGTALMQRMSAQELLTEKTSRAWVQDLPLLIKVLNKKREQQQKEIRNEPDNKLKCAGDSCEILPIGTKVRVALEKPIQVAKNANDSKPIGNFRSGDIRWGREVRTIKEVLLKPNFPPMYFVSKIEDPNEALPVAYTKNQLQVVQENEKMPDASIIREEVVPPVRKTRAEKEAEQLQQEEEVRQQKEEIKKKKAEQPKEEGTLEKITKRYKSGNKILFNVKVTGIKELQTYTRKDLLQVAPDLVQEYEESHPKRR